MRDEVPRVFEDFLERTLREDSFEGRLEESEYADLIHEEWGRLGQRGQNHAQKLNTKLPALPLLDRQRTEPRELKGLCCGRGEIKVKSVPNPVEPCQKQHNRLEFTIMSEIFQTMRSHPVDTLLKKSGLQAVGMFCGLALTMSACTKSSSLHPSHVSSPTSQIGSPPPSHQVEVQLLQTLETAESLGEGNPLLLSSLYSLAAYYQEQGQLGKAEFQYKRALHLKEQLSGPEHPDVATILHNYAGLLREAHRYREAENLSARANAIMAKHSPASNVP